MLLSGRGVAGKEERDRGDAWLHTADHRGRGARLDAGGGPSPRPAGPGHSGTEGAAPAHDALRSRRTGRRRRRFGRGTRGHGRFVPLRLPCRARQRRPYHPRDGARLAADRLRAHRLHPGPRLMVEPHLLGLPRLLQPQRAVGPFAGRGPPLARRGPCLLRGVSRPRRGVQSVVCRRPVLRRRRAAGGLGAARGGDLRPRGLHVSHAARRALRRLWRAFQWRGPTRQCARDVVRGGQHRTRLPSAPVSSLVAPVRHPRRRRGSEERLFRAAPGSTPISCL